MRKWIHSCVNLFYPVLCLHCKSPLTGDSRQFCRTCASLLQLIDPAERCPRCFSLDYCPKRLLCGTCKKNPPSTTHSAAAFDHQGPAASLIQQMKYGGQPYLAKGAAAYMAIQFDALQWPTPDVLVPVPVSFMRLAERGYNQSLELAVHLAPYLNSSILQALKRSSGGYSQAGLSRNLRLTLETSVFTLKNNIQLHDKVILLIDDVSTTGSTLNQCADVLQEQCPQAIYAFTFCRAVK